MFRVHGMLRTFWVHYDIAGYVGAPFITLIAIEHLYYLKVAQKIL